MHRILITGPSTRTKSGGQITHLENLSKTFSNSDKVSLKILPTSRGLHNEEPTHKKIVEFISAATSLLIQARSYDLIHINSTFDNRSIIRDTIFSIILILANRSFLIQYHGGTPNRASILKHYLIKKIYTRTATRAKRILVLTNKQSSELQENFGLTSSLVRNFVASPSNLKEKKPSAPLTFLYLGRLDRTKGVFELINSFCNLHKKGAQFNLIIAGSGPERENLIALSRSVEINNKVKFLDYITGDTKDTVLRTADVMILPSYSEGLPYSILEGLSYGIPIISTPVGAIPEILDEGETVLYIKPKSTESLTKTLENIIKNPEQLYSLSINAAKKSREFTLQKMHDTYLPIWLSSLA
jgi:glycosyltransferase involved in cell wall biosynthesis